MDQGEINAANQKFIEDTTEALIKFQRRVADLADSFTGAIVGEFEKLGTISKD